jgi:hypothetical protein
MEESSMEKYKIEMMKEYKVLPPMDENAVETAINSCAIEGWQVLVFSRTAEGNYYTLLFRTKQKQLRLKGQSID